MTDDTRAELSDEEIAAIRELAIAVLADRLYCINNDAWANRDLVDRWNATITPTLILQLTRGPAERTRCAAIARAHGAEDAAREMES